MRIFLVLIFFLSLPLCAETEVPANDPFLPYLDGKAPEILREIPNCKPVPEGVTLRQVVFRSRDQSEIFAVIAQPNSAGPHPGLLVLHGGGGSAEEDKAMGWARRGYVAVAPDLPGIAEPKKMPSTHGRWENMKYGEGRWVAEPDASASVIFDAVLSAMKSLYLLRVLPDVDTTRVGVVGVSWGGYMTTMVCGLAGDQVRAGFALYGCGFFDRGGYGQEKKEPFNPKLPRTSLGRMSETERNRWFQQLDAGRRASGMKAAYFLAAATNDFFGYLTSAQATLDAIPGEKNHVFAPNANHKLPVPGGSLYDINPPKDFKPTAFQPFPTPVGEKDTWAAMEVPYFEYYLQGRGEPFPKVTVEPSPNPRLARFRVAASHAMTKVEVYGAPANPDPKARVWSPLPAVKSADGIYEAALPEGTANWFALVSDDRPVSVSSDLVSVQTSPIVQ
jgi:dienelactone hydrolase